MGFVFQSLRFSAEGDGCRSAGAAASLREAAQDASSIYPATASRLSRVQTLIAQDTALRLNPAGAWLIRLEAFV